MRIDTITGRKELKVRMEPYYVKIRENQHLGYRKGKTGGSWTARLKVDGQRKVKKLEVKFDPTKKEYGIALTLAQEWFKLQEQGVEAEYTLQDAIDDYVSYLREEKSDAVYKTAAAVLKGIPAKMKKTPVYKLTTRQLDTWRKSFLKKGTAEEVRKGKNTSNRRWSDLRACLNRAFQQGYVADRIAWERVQPYKKAQKGRQIFWSAEETRKILDEAKSLNMDFYHLIKAGLLTGARVGELRALKVKDFDKEIGTLQVDGKTGHRNMFLSPAAVTFFNQQAKDKLPTAWLLDYKGRQWPEDYHHKLFRKVRKTAEIDLESTFYCCRHYHISQGLQAGISPDLIAKNCGTSPDMIFRFYGKFTGQAQKEAAAAVGAALGVE